MDDFLRRMQEQQDMIRRLSEGPAAEFLRNQQALERMAEQISRPGFLAALEDASRQAELFYERLREPGFVVAIERANRQLESVARDIVTAREHAALQIESMAFTVDAALRALPTIEFDRIGSLIAASDAARRDALASTTGRLIRRHTRLMADIAAPGAVEVLPAPAVEMPGQNLFVHTGAVRVVTPHTRLHADEEQQALTIRSEISDDTVVFLEITLPLLKPAFLEQYRAAKACIRDRGPDWWTQGSASMRKLLKGVLHTAAPSEVVGPWARQNNKPFDDHGDPTREAKIEWLCEPIPGSAYRAFVRAELSSAIALIKLVDAAQHVDEFPEFEQQYAWTVLRAEVAIKHILVLWRLRTQERTDSPR
jgi:hypothetical protein